MNLCFNLSYGFASMGKILADCAPQPFYKGFAMTDWCASLRGDFPLSLRGEAEAIYNTESRLKDSIVKFNLAQHYRLPRIASDSRNDKVGSSQKSDIIDCHDSANAESRNDRWGDSTFCNDEKQTDLSLQGNISDEASVAKATDPHLQIYSLAYIKSKGEIWK